jgi:hypothetical protein
MRDRAFDAMRDALTDVGICGLRELIYAVAGGVSYPKAGEQFTEDGGGQWGFFSRAFLRLPF